MSILIRGMEMPTGERPVHIEIHRDGTVIQWKLYESDEIIGTAVEVPPHGRLIDADALLKDARKWVDAYWIDMAPTIIESED